MTRHFSAEDFGFDVDGWLDDFESAGGRIHCDGENFAVILPAEIDDPRWCLVQWGSVIEAALQRVRRRYGRGRAV